jgi:hypothetical protein
MNNTKFLKTLLLLCILPIGLCVLLHSCKPDDNSLGVPDFKYDYVPYDSGKYVIYNVDSIYSYNSNFTKDTASYQLMTIVGDTFYDLQNEINRRMWLYRRETSSDPWVFDRLWYIKRKAITFESIEDDLRFTKLVFPPNLSTEWNGNSYLPVDQDMYKDFNGWNYRYVHIDEPYTINGSTIDSSLTVEDVQDTTGVIINYRFKKEVYGKHIGLISMDYSIRSRQIDLNKPWDESRWTGFVLRWRMTDHN